MKKTFNINVAGFPFVIDEDAYTLLNDYLKTIEHAFRNVDGSAELISDIESRIAELLLQAAEDGSAIITLTDVEQVIARVGKPEEFVDEETITIEDEDGNSTTVETESQNMTPPPYIPNPPRTPKRLYRDPQNAMLGGVCSGLAWYLGWDVTWVRLLFVAVTILSYATVAIVYLVLWIVVPEARTPLQRMQMMGEQPTMENIGRTVTDSFKESEGIQSATQPTTAPQAAGILSQSFSLIAKIVIMCGLIIGVPILVGMALGLLGCIIFLISWGSSLIFGTGMPFDHEEFRNPWLSHVIFWGVLCGIGWILTLGIPLMYLVRRGFNYQPIARQTRRVINVIWVIGFLIAGISTGMVISTAYENETYDYNEWKSKERSRREMEKSDFQQAIETMSAEELQAKIEQLNAQAESYQKQADDFQQQAEQFLQKAEDAVQKRDTLANSDANNRRLDRMIEKYQNQAEKAQKKAEKYQGKAQKQLDKAETVMERLLDISVVRSDNAETTSTDSVAKQN